VQFAAELELDCALITDEFNEMNSPRRSKVFLIAVGLNVLVSSVF
jgi:hypothetical protein